MPGQVHEQTDLGEKSKPGTGPGVQGSSYLMRVAFPGLVFREVHTQEGPYSGVTAQEGPARRTPLTILILSSDCLEMLVI